MSLVASNALVAIAVGGGSPANQPANGSLTASAGATLVFSLQATSLVQRWEISLQCDDATLNGQRFVWQAGQQNAITIPTPSAPYAMTYTSLVSDGASSTATVSGKVNSIGASTGGGTTTTALDFTQPAPGALVGVTLTNPALATVGKGLTIAGAGFYNCEGLAGSIATCRNGTSVVNAAAGTIIAAGAVVSPGGSGAPQVGTAANGQALVLAGASFLPVGHRGVINALSRGAYNNNTNDDWAACSATVQAMTATGVEASCAYFPSNQSFSGSYSPAASPSGYKFSRPLVHNVPNGTVCGDSGALGVPRPAPTLFNSSAYLGPHTFLTAPNVPSPPITTVGSLSMVDSNSTSVNDPLFLDLSERSTGSLDGLPTITVEAFVYIYTTIGSADYSTLLESAGYQPDVASPSLVESLTFSIIGILGTNNSLQCALTTTSGGFVVRTPAMSTGVLHFIVMSYDGAFLRAYVDGVYQAKVAVTGTISQQWYESLALFATNRVFPQLGTTNTGGTVRVDSIRISANARYTSEAAGTPYPPPTTELACDASTIELLNFSNATCLNTQSANGFGTSAQAQDYAGTQDNGLVAGISGYDPVAKAARGHYINTWHQWRNTWGPSNGYVNKAVMRDIMGYGYEGVEANLASLAKIERVPQYPSGNAKIHTFRNNCYEALCVECEGIATQAVGTAHAWCLAALNACYMRFSSCIVQGGDSFTYVIGDNSVTIENVVQDVSQGRGSVYAYTNGGGSLTFDDVFLNDEGGSTSAETLLIIGNWDSVRYIKGGFGPQGSSGNLPSCVIVNAAAYAIFEFATNVIGSASSLALFKFVGALPLLVDCKRATRLAGGTWPWMAAANEGPMLGPGEDTGIATIATSVSATMTIEEFLQKTIVVAGAPSAGITITLPLIAGYVRYFYQTTGQTVTFGGATGGSFSLGTGKSCIGRCDGTNWIKVSPDT